MGMTNIKKEMHGSLNEFHAINRNVIPNLMECR